MSGTWAIRPAVAGDAGALAELAERTFRDAFAAQNRPKDMDLHCAREFGPAIQAAEIADPTIATLVAERDGALIAFAQLHCAPASPPPCPAVAGLPELRRLYVDRRWHGSGLAGVLLERVFELASRDGATALWLGVWERNPRAMAFYRRLGFAEVGEHTFLLGADPQRDLVLLRGLR